jgi:hypothetical protein
MKYDVVVLGAGAAGLMAAITAASRKKSVLVIERSNKVGKKFLCLVEVAVILRIQI